MKPSVALAAGALLVASLPLQAQTDVRRVEMSPFYGYLWGGTTSLLTFAGPLRTPELRYELADHTTYGLRIGYRAGAHLEPEIQWSHTETGVRSAGESPGAEVCSGRPCFKVDYFLGGVTYNIGRGPIQPFAALSAGVARLSPVLSISPDAVSVRKESAVRFTGALGLGAKAFLTPAFGFRVDARGYATRTAGLILVGPICTIFRDEGPGQPLVPVTGDCGTKPWLYTGDVTGGIVLAF